MGLIAQRKPQITVAPERVRSGDFLLLKGSGFTPKAVVMSYLRRPDDSEYNPLRVRTDDRGELVHKIDSTMLDPGMFELWIEDGAAKTVSNHVHFTVDR